MLVLINYEPDDQTACVQLKDGWQVERALGLTGEMPFETTENQLRIALPHNNGAFIFLRK